MKNKLFIIILLGLLLVGIAILITAFQLTGTNVLGWFRTPQGILVIFVTVIIVVIGLSLYIKKR